MNILNYIKKVLSVEIINAIQYLKNSGFASNNSNKWINGVLQKSLDEQLTEEIINSFISGLFGEQENKIDLNCSEEAVTDIVDKVDNSVLKVLKIKEITEVNNFGLLKIKDPICLNDGLNVFYGLNGVGKSSLYKAICSVLKCNVSRKCIPDIDYDNNNMVSKIKILDSEGKEKLIEYKNDYSNLNANIKVFDNYISNFIVNNDQENEFEVPYLKQEIFYTIRGLLEHLSDEFDNKRSIYNKRIQEIKTILSNKILFLDENYKNIEQKIKGNRFDTNDKRNLERLKGEKISIQSDTATFLLMSLKDRLGDIDTILSKFYTITKEKEQLDYKLNFGLEFISNCNKVIFEYQKYKLLYQENRVDKLSNYISNDWMKNINWTRFIEAGLAFVGSLEEKDKQKYSQDTCPYCNQSLDGKSRELVKAYTNIKNDFKDGLDKNKRLIDEFTSDLQELLKYTEGLSIINTKINQSVSKISNNIKIDVDITCIKEYIYKIINNLSQYEEVDVEGIILVESNISKYIQVKNDVCSKIKEINSSVTEKESKIMEINKKTECLSQSEMILNNITLINELINEKKLIEDIDNKKSSLVKLKSNLSKQENSFSKESIMKIFNEKLLEEYRFLKLVPPKKFCIKPQKNKRQCRIGSYKVSDIYSEGELKIHSLAEFFATGEVDEFKGVYIFDDPVNSLDYERMEYVKNRMKKVIEDGNQVLVFTHNIYFLNSLVNVEKDKVNQIRKSKNQVYVINTILGDKNKSINLLKNKVKIVMIELRKKSIDDINEIELANVYDLMSGCLENFVENKLLNGLISRYRPNIRMYSLMELKRIDNELVDKIYELYNNTSRYGNRHDSPLEASQPTLDNLLVDYESFKEIMK